ncbi:MAG TPA: class II fructose-bisphosphate aldolase [Oscillospiraceae bacterium]|nr:class II fructose-bisphosphate aldolase [Oscillospiraceae bacterium]
MSYVNMRSLLLKARADGYAVGAFNIVNYLTAQAAIQKAVELSSPIILQTSVSTVRQIGPEKLISFLRALAEETPIPVAVHLDHCTDPEYVVKCLDLGWSSVMIDLSQAPFERNLAETMRIVEYAEQKNATVEGELGAIIGVEDDIRAGESVLADPGKSLEYVVKTGVDAFAPAIGTAHGLYKGEPKLDYDLFKKLSSEIPCPLVVHGGTGLRPEVFRRLIDLGASKINVSTAVKISYCQGMLAYMSEHPDENNPLKLDSYVMERTKACVEEHIRMFGSAGRAAN